jgi:hypothetical protein
MGIQQKEVMQQSLVLTIPEAVEEKGLVENDLTPENSAYLLPMSETIVRYAAGKISYQEYRETLNAWWEENKEAWQENDLSRLFLLTCLNS